MNHRLSFPPRLFSGGLLRGILRGRRKLQEYPFPNRVKAPVVKRQIYLKLRSRYSKQTD